APPARLGRADGVAVPPAVHEHDLVADGPDDLTGDVTGLVAGQPGHERRGEGRVHAVPLGELVGFLGLDAGTGDRRGHAGGTGGPDAVDGDAQLEDLEADR